MNAHHSEWLESVSPTYRHRRDALDFCNLSRCEQLVRCPTHIAGSRLDLVMTDAYDIVDVFVGTPQGTSGHGFVSCELRVEQSAPKYNVISTVFLKHRTNLGNVGCAVMSSTWNTILKSADPLDAFDRAIGVVIGRLVPTTVLHSRSEDKQWFDAAAGELIMLSRLLIIVPGVAHVRQIIGVNLCLLVLRPRGSMDPLGPYCDLGGHIKSIRMNPLGVTQRDYGPSESHNERTRILGSTPPVHISGGRHLNTRSLV